MDLKGSGVYKNHRIHAAQLVSGVWVASVVKLGPSARAGGPIVEGVRGEYATQVEAVAAAMRHVDQDSAASETSPC